MDNGISYLLDRLAEQQIQLRVENENLKINFNSDSIDPEILKEIKGNKKELITYLNKYNSKQEYASIPAIPLQEDYPLSQGQLRIWMMSQEEEANVAYNLPFYKVCYGVCHFETFKKAVDWAVDRHEILRTVFRVNEQGDVRQKILKTGELQLDLQLIDYTNEEDKWTLIDHYTKADVLKPFDLEKGPLFRVYIFKIEENVFSFYRNMHHIISDEWSVDILGRDVFTCYYALLENTTPDILPLSIQYKDYTAWQATQVKGAEYQESKTYWLEQLSGHLPRLDLPTSKIRPSELTFNGRTLELYIPKELSQAIKQYCLKNSGSLYMGLMTSLLTLFYKYTGQGDMITGCSVAGRDHPDLEEQIGFYVNTLAIRNRIEGTSSFEDLFQKVRQTLLNAYKHQSFNFDNLIKELRPPVDLSRNPLIDVFINLLNTSGDNEKKETAESVDGETTYWEEPLLFDLEFTFKEKGDAIILWLSYNKAIYEQEVINKFFEHYLIWLDRLLSNPEASIDTLSYLSEEERQQVLHQFNDTAIIPFEPATIVDVFSQQATATPDHLAVSFEDRQITYRDLASASDELATFLNHKGLGEESLVALCTHQSIEMITGILGILKSGGAYVPIDPEYPDKRIAYILDDTGVNILLCSKKMIPRLSKITNIQLIGLDDPLPPLNVGLNEIVSVQARPSNLACVIYTSGSTGTPKGVLVEHQSIVNIVKDRIQLFAMDDRENVLLSANYVFDASVALIFLPLFTGSKLTLIKKELLLDNEQLANFINQQEITHIDLVPNLLRNLTPQTFPSLKRLITGGEKCPQDLADQWQKYIDFYNEYGPTEATIVSTSYQVDKEKPTTKLPIGRPISNAQIYITRTLGDLTGIGVTGDIYIAGKGVARGYLNQPELTAEKFVDDPFSDIPGAKMYYSGDLGSWLPDGNIEFADRKDNQVKIRGYRIELGEIEKVLESSSMIAQAIVTIREEVKGQRKLVAFVVLEKLEEDTSFSKAKLKKYLMGLLPDYMIPTIIMKIDQLPMNANGKIDRGALKQIPLTPPENIKFEAPRNHVEEVLVDVWGELLGVERISIHDDFFDLGGHSLLATQVIIRVRERLQVNLSIAKVFQLPSINTLAAYITLKTNESTLEHDEEIDIDDLFESIDLV